MVMSKSNGGKEKWDEEKEKEEKRGRNIFTRAWINKDRKTRVGGEENEMVKEKR